jgi:hypothetical protein
VSLADYHFSPEQRAQGAADLKAAALVIQLNGWTQNLLARLMDNLPPALSPVCALGAVNVAVWGDPHGNGIDYTEASHDARGIRRAVARRALDFQVGYGVAFSGVDWNDAPGRTAEEVIGALNAAAVALEEAK